MKLRVFFGDIAALGQGALGFLMSHRKTLSLLVVMCLALTVPFSAEANVNLGCRADGDIFPDLGCVLGEIMLKLASIFAFITGNVLDLVVKFFVFEMSTTLETGNIFTIGDSGVPVYRQMWFIVRDLANLSFIFILVYVSISTIFKLGKADYRRVVPVLVLIAILMNFSLFFVQVAVDVSNYVAYQFFTNVELNVVDEDGETVISDETGEPLRGRLASNDQQGLSNVIMNVTRVTALVASPADLADTPTEGGNAAPGQPGFAFGFFAAIFVFIAGLVMLAGAALLFIRFFMILVYMVASPAAFAAYILEGGKGNGYFKKWSSGLTSQLIFAPAYFALMYLSLQFLSSIAPNAGLSVPDGDGIAYWVSNAFVFTISAAFLIYSLIAAKSMGATGAGAVNSLTKKMGGYMLAGGAAALGRNTVGRLANNLSSGEREKRLQNRIARGGMSGAMAKMQLKSLKGVAGAGFDLRTTAKYIPGVTTDDFRFIKEGKVDRSFGERREEKAKARDTEAAETRKFLDADAKKYFNARLDTKKDGVLGLLQAAAFKRDRDGTATPRAITSAFIESEHAKDFVEDWKGIKGGTKNIWGDLREGLGLDREGRLMYPDTSKRKIQKLEQSIARDRELYPSNLEKIDDSLVRYAAQRYVDLSNKKEPLTETETTQLANLAKTIDGADAANKEAANKAVKLGNRLYEKSQKLEELQNEKVFYEKKLSALENDEKERLESAYEFNGGMVGVVAESKLMSDNKAEQERLVKQYEQHRIDQNGADRVKAINEEVKLIHQDMTQATRALEQIERNLRNTTKDRRRVDGALADLSGLKSQLASHSGNLEVFKDKDKKAYERYQKLIGQEAELTADKKRLLSLEADQKQQYQEESRKTRESHAKSRKKLNNLYSLEVNVMDKNAYIKGSYANQRAADAGFKELQSAKSKKKEGIDYDALARAVEQGVDDSNLGGDRDRDDGGGGLGV